MQKIDFDYFYIDEPLERRLKLTFLSKSKREICVGRDTWPSSSGEMNTERSNGAYLFVQNRIYAFQDSDNAGYCPDKSCYHPLDEGEKVEAYIHYDAFGLDDGTYAMPKELKYRPQPFWCDQGYWPK